mmetsp:Transcript_15276/g.18898  ORF Transcript_15276/g.18898 Transcript_15276/m.18898 type:complete len:116 (+) Transcript_15276:545-892(+)
MDGPMLTAELLPVGIPKCHAVLMCVDENGYITFLEPNAYEHPKQTGFPAAGLLMRWHQVQVEAKIFTRVKAPKIVANKFSQPGVNSISITPYQLCTSRMPSQQRMRKLWKFKVTK